MTGTSEVRPNHRFDERALAAFLAANLGDYGGDLTVRQFVAGESNPTFLLDAGGRRYVLRKQPPGELLPTAHAVDREYRVLAALQQTAVPVPRTFLLCEDAAVIGTPFYLMEFVDGRVFRDEALPELAPAERRAASLEAIRVLAALHGVDPRAAGLADLGRSSGYVARQVRRWSQQYLATRTEQIASMERLMAWLPEHLPADDRTAIVHGDYRLDNLLFHPTAPRVLALLDWELATLGHPFSDLAYYCMKYHIDILGQGCLADLAGAESGIPTEEECLFAYCRQSGIDEIPDWRVFLVFSLFRIAAILQGVYKRGLQGNASSPRALDLGRFVRRASDAAWALATGCRR